jgi:hypothetical protein
VTWRIWLTCAGVGCAGALAYRSYWALAAGVAAIVLVRAILQVLAGLVVLVPEARESLRPERAPAPRAPRVHWQPRPPWLTAPMPVAVLEADPGSVAAGRHRKERGLRDAAATALRAAARVPLP